MEHERWRVPDRVFWTLSIIINLLTWGSLAYFYRDLPSTIPIHFGLYGQADGFAAKSVWTVLMPAIMQSALTGLFAWVYRHPQYANLPASLTLTFVDEPWRGRISHILRHLFVMISVITNLIFAYVALGVVNAGLGLATGLNGWIIFGLVGLLLVIIVTYTVWLGRWSREVMAAKRQAN